LNTPVIDNDDPTLRDGLRLAAPLLPAVFVLGASFGVLARAADVGALAAVVMSATTFAGSAQVAAISVLGAGGGVAAAVAAALLLNARYAPIGISVARSFRGSVAKRFLQAQLVVDESWALSRGHLPILLGVGATLWVGWVGGTAVGAVAGEAIDDTSAFGLDGAFAALFLALLATQLGDRGRVRVAVAGAAIAALLIPFAPAGVPIVAATGAVVIGLKRP
jgi:branched chain amino acid efflux pump